MIGLDDGDVRILLGDALVELATLPSRSVHLVCSSPPFWGLRDYGTSSWVEGDPECDHKAISDDELHRRYLQSSGLAGADRKPSATQTAAARRFQSVTPCPKCGARRVDAQIGLESTPEEWCARLVAVYRECHRILRDDGVMLVEVGDTYSAAPPGTISVGATSLLARTANDRARFAASVGTKMDTRAPGLKQKDLVGAPWLLAFALRADGWYLRSEMIWSRPNPMPESVTDRPTKSHSTVFLLSKRPRYYWDPEAIREPAANDPRAGGRQRALALAQARYADAEWQTDATDGGRRQRLNGPSAPALANARSVWTIPTAATPFAHFATFPQALVERWLAAGTSEHGACARCGAPWRRVVERTRYEPPAAPPGHLKADGAGRNDGDRNIGGADYRRQVRTLGEHWEASCKCGISDVEPCVVLDPFMGSGTTALVARRMNRRAIGVELNPEYLAIARRRLAQLSLFAPAIDL